MGERKYITKAKLRSWEKTGAGIPKFFKCGKEVPIEDIKIRVIEDVGEENKGS